MEITLYLIILLILLIFGTHIGVALGASALTILIIFEDTNLNVISQQTFASVNNYALAAIPFFILVGDIVMKGDLAKRLLDLADILLRKIHGGTAMAAMIVSVFFASISGSSVASTSALGKNVVNLLGEKGYPKRFIAGLVATGGTIGLLIPPSLSFILIGSMMGIPVIDLFTAGIVPGVLQGVMLILVTWWISRKNNWESNFNTVKVTPKIIGKKFKSSTGMLLLPVVILGGIYSGMFTPTEAAAVAVFYALLLVILLRKTNMMGVWSMFKGALLQSGMIYLIVIGGALTAFMLQSLGLTQELISYIANSGIDGWKFLLIVNVFLLLLGMFLDGISVIVLVSPLLFPIATAAGIDPIHFAVVLTLNIEVATVTPPVGLNLFVMSGLTKIPIEEVAKGVGPYYLVLIVSLILVTYFPQLSLMLLR
ncbi:TRAP transporter large permease [Lentibacillus jeotgali]|uniref:TRAP transporter large permease n=1 Tax=Lentibacillus jeotgali TaxID=558169 RepID=UPI00026283F7|nr:TRAP transporter large permease [Lentibacillus jeotgali]